MMQSIFTRAMKIKYTLAYIVMIPLINMLLPILPLFDFGNGTKFTPISLIVGVIYILRDFAQNEVGRKRIFIAMGIAAALTYKLAHPAQAIASLLAFLCGEIADWTVYSFSERPLSQRVLISNLIAIPIDIIVVLTGFQIALPGFLAFSFANMTIMFTSNMISAVIMFFILRHREQQSQKALTQNR